MRRIIVDPEWDWKTTYNVSLIIEEFLWERHGIDLDSVKIIRADKPNWGIDIPKKLIYVPTVDIGMLGPQDSGEVEEIRLSQCFAEDPWGTRYTWWMGYGPRSKCLAIGDWEGATDFVQSEGTC